MRKIAIVTASNTPYLPLLEGMLASIGGGGGASWRNSISASSTWG